MGCSSSKVSDDIASLSDKDAGEVNRAPEKVRAPAKPEDAKAGNNQAGPGSKRVRRGSVSAEVEKENKEETFVPKVKKKKESKLRT